MILSDLPMESECKALRDQIWSRARVKRCMERRWHEEALKLRKQGKGQEWKRREQWTNPFQLWHLELLLLVYNIKSPRCSAVNGQLPVIL